MKIVIRKVFFLAILFTLFLSFENVFAKEVQIELEKVNILSKAEGVVVDNPIINDNMVKLNTSFNKESDYVEYELVLKNIDEDKWKIGSIEDENTSDNITIEYDYDKNYVSKDKTIKVRVKITYSKKLVNTNDTIIDDLLVKINLISVNGDEDTIVINNPITGDKVHKYYILLGFALLGFILAVSKKRIKKLKVGNLILLLAIVMSPLAIFAEENYKKDLTLSTITLKSEMLPYDISFDTDGGKDIETKIIRYGQKLGELPQAEKEGYTFKTWKDENNEQVTSETVVTDNMNLKAYYNINKYNLTFNNKEYIDLNNSTKEGSYNYNTNIILKAVNKNKQRFVKWSNGDTTMETEFKLVDNTEIGPIMEPDVFTVSFDTNGGTNCSSMTVYNNEEIGSLPNTYKDGENFKGWYTDSEFNNKVSSDFVVTKDVVLYAKWDTERLTTVFEQEGACTFNGKNGTITGSECSNYVGKKYIDTGIKLYSEKNINKDYEIGFTIEHYLPSEQDSGIAQQTFMNTKLEGNKYPGLVFRRSSDNLSIASRRTNSANSEYSTNYKNFSDVKIFREYNDEKGIMEIFYQINGGNKVKLNDLSAFNPTFDLNVWFGAAPSNVEGTEAQRYLTGTLSNMYIKLDQSVDEEVKVTFNSNGGEEENKYVTVTKGFRLGSLPEVTRNGYIFEGWYTGITDGVLVDENTVPVENVVYYAHWKKIEMETVFSQEEACTFNGKNSNITGCENYSDTNFINTGIKLYSEENYYKDYEIYFEIEDYNPDIQEDSKNTAFMDTKYETDGNNIVPGLVVRKSAEADKIEITQAINGTRATKVFNYNSVNSIKIVRQNKKVYYSINGGDLFFLQDMSNFSEFYDVPLTFGAALTDSDTPFRFLKGTLKNMYIKVGIYN